MSARQIDETDFELWTDFDQLDPDDCCWVSLRFLQRDRRPHAGDWVHLGDERGNGCMACVQEVHGWTARVAPDWNTWSGEALPRMARESWRRLRDV